MGRVSSKLQELIVSKVDSDGVLKEEITHSAKGFVVEPNFVKLYQDDMALLYGLSSTRMNVLSELAKMMTYNDNRVTITRSQKEDIAEAIGVKLGTVNEAVKHLSSSGLITSYARSNYIINPYLFGKGSWKDIKEVRRTVIYNKDGKQVVLKVIKKGE